MTPTDVTDAKERPQAGRSPLRSGAHVFAPSCVRGRVLTCVFFRVWVLRAELQSSIFLKARAMNIDYGAEMAKGPFERLYEGNLLSLYGMDLDFIDL